MRKIGKKHEEGRNKKTTLGESKNKKKEGDPKSSGCNKQENRKNEQEDSGKNKKFGEKEERVEKLKK